VQAQRWRARNAARARACRAAASMPLRDKFPGWGWASYLVSVGAVFGIGTVLLVRAPWGSLE